FTCVNCISKILLCKRFSFIIPKK
ncbi:2-C-methyl-D-erythritol 4-phosphate cytidylyltransferase, partial [Klebsiella pneumoniae]|nr:2-C-methyl-D-erythritol 4-phosphate cytidylyltransferase [Klebsiella pneumoniae]